MNIIDLEKPDGVLVQFGWQRPLNIANKLQEQGVNIIGTDPKSIDLGTILQYPAWLHLKNLNLWVYKIK